jgi:hypothetical protein
VRQSAHGHRLIRKEEEMLFTKSQIRKCSGERSVAKEDGMNSEKMSDKNGSIGILRTIRSIAGVRVAALSVLVVAFSATAMASCGDSLSAMAAAAASVRNQSQVSQSSLQNGSAAASDNAVNTSIVGLWHIRFQVGDQTIQEAFQIWNTGGTEVHNPNVDPRSGSICLGVWKEKAPRTFRLTHRVWSYDVSGNFLGTINLTETLVLGDRGNTHSGSFTLDFYDPSGNFLFEVPGSVIGERISIN